MCILRIAAESKEMFCRGAFFNAKLQVKAKTRMQQNIYSKAKSP